jgi:hypothetical protein
MTLADSGLVKGASKTSVKEGIPEISDVLVAYATIEGKNTTNSFLYGRLFHCYCQLTQFRSFIYELCTCL